MKQNFCRFLISLILANGSAAWAEGLSHFESDAAKGAAAARTEVTAENRDEPLPTPPQASLSDIHIRDGFEVQMVASEPLVKDPVAIDWGTDGKLWVVEMADYPLGMDGEGKPGGRVRVLEDTDGDGNYDSSNLFADGLRFPNGILVWGNGVLVTAAPEILYLEDSTGDGRADIMRSLYSGFLEGNQQLRVNGLRWGLDNWVHCASGSHHSGYGKENRITSAIAGTSHHIGSRDFRIRPDTGEIDPLSGPSQYGRNRGDWGHWFGVQNSRPLWHYVLDDRDIRRNPHFAPPDPKHQVVTPINPPVYPAAALQKRFHSFDQSGRFTSACSAMIYRDDLLFDRQENEQHAFTCEPFHNLVQHNIIFDDGVSFGFRRDPAESELDFFASRDRWCRPVMVRTGPDGALWVVDMYRYMIEHPQWLPQNGKDELRPYFRHGEDQGRIYRIVPAGGQPRKVLPLHERSEADLVAALKSPNGWQRDVAQQMLVRKSGKLAEKSDAATVGLLEKMARSDDEPLARLHALCTLDGIDALDPEVLQSALIDSHPGVRRQAVRLAATRRVDIGSLTRMVGDADAKVRLQLAATLGAYDGVAAAEGLATLAAHSASNPYIIANVMSSLHSRNSADVLASYIDQTLHQKVYQEDQLELLELLFGQVAALGDGSAIGRIIEISCRTNDDHFHNWQLSGVAALLERLDRRKFSRTELSEPQQQLIDQVIAEARTVVANAADTSMERTAAALKLLLRQPVAYSADMKQLADLLVPQSSVELQLAVMDHLADQSDPQVAGILLARWKSHGPVLRARVLDVLVSRTAWTRTLLNQVESGRVSPTEIGPAIRERLLSTKDESLQTTWKKVFAATLATDRKQMVDQYRSALSLEGDLVRGARLFKKHCAACHRLAGDGHDVGPNLASITDKRPEALLSAMLDPSAAVEARYVTYLALTLDGRVHSGLLATETGSSITLLNSEGKQQKILRSEIEELHASGKSLMPDGLEKELSPQDIADVIHFVRSAGADKGSKP